MPRGKISWRYINLLVVFWTRIPHLRTNYSFSGIEKKKKKGRKIKKRKKERKSDQAKEICGERQQEKNPDQNHSKHFTQVDAKERGKKTERPSYTNNKQSWHDQHLCPLHIIIPKAVRTVPYHAWHGQNPIFISPFLYPIPNSEFSFPSNNKEVLSRGILVQNRPSFWI